MSPRNLRSNSAPNKDAVALSPGQRHVLKEMEKTSQREALRELMGMRRSNCGKLPHGAIRMIVRKYQERGFTAVTERNLRYQIEREAQGMPTLDTINQPPIKRIDFQARSESSPLTDDKEIGEQSVVASVVSEENNNTKKAGRKKQKNKRTTQKISSCLPFQSCNRIQ
jgi:hypothetical protein